MCAVLLINPTIAVTTNAIVKAGNVAPIAVSYTHLDVYKRQDTNTAETVTFGATIILGNNGNVGVARMIAPIGTVLTTPELIDILDGFKLTNSLNINNSSQVL